MTGPYSFSHFAFGKRSSGSMPASSMIEPRKSCGVTGRSLTLSVVSSLLPTTQPPLKPPPATSAEKQRGKWLRPPFHGGWRSTFGTRPNSPETHTIVESSRSCSLRSCRSVATAWSISAEGRRIVSKWRLCESQPL